MKLFLSLIFSCFILTACTIGSDTSRASRSSEGSPYPSTPLSASGTAASPALTTTGGKDYLANGTEPFWSAEVRRNRLTFSRPGESQVSTQTFDVMQEDKGAIITLRDAKGEFFLTLTKGACNDGMSDKKYTHGATVMMGAETLTGCAIEP